MNPAISTLLTPEQVAERLQIPPDTVRGYLRSGKIKGFHVARKWRVTEESLATYVRDLEENWASPSPMAMAAG